jgi:hypothetical protein
MILDNSGDAEQAFNASEQLMFCTISHCTKALAHIIEGLRWSTEPLHYGGMEQEHGEEMPAEVVLWDMSNLGRLPQWTWSEPPASRNRSRIAQGGSSFVRAGSH